MGVDPADFYQENIHSFNRYTYANNNPYAYVDPDGNLPILLVAYGIYKAASIAYDAYTTYQTVSDSSTSTTEKVVAVASLAAGAVDPTGAANKLKSLSRLSKATKSVTKSGGRSGKQARLRELANDPKLGKADRGWIKQEQNSIARGNRKTIRNPPGKDLAHERGRETAKGYGYKYSNLQDRKLHRTQHKYDNFGRNNKERPPQ